MNAIRTYKDNRIHGAPNEQVLLMLLETAINVQTNAAEAMERGDRNAWNAQIHHARAIFIELMSALDHELAPALTRNLQLVYAWCIHSLGEAARSGKIDTLHDVHRVTCSLYQAWVEAVQTAHDDADADETAAPAK